MHKKRENKIGRSRPFGPGMVCYGTYYMVSCHSMVWYHTIPYTVSYRSRNIIKHFYDFDVIFFDSTRKPCFWHSAHEFPIWQNHKNFLWWPRKNCGIFYDIEGCWYTPDNIIKTFYDGFTYSEIIEDIHISLYHDREERSYFAHNKNILKILYLSFSLISPPQIVTRTRSSYATSM